MVTPEDYITAKKITDEYERNVVIRKSQEKYNPADYIVLNPIGELAYLEKDKLAVGVRNFLLTGDSCLMYFDHDGRKYKRKCTGFIPSNMAGKICSVQIYELIED